MTERHRLAAAPRVSAIQRWVTLAAVTTLAAALCFSGLGRNGVHELDEAWQAQAALEMFRSGNLWHPTVFGHPFFSKPALPLWLTAAAYHLFGVNDFATRFWAASFAVAAVGATYVLGEWLGGVAVGGLAGLILATAYPFLYTHCARTGEFDSLMVFCFVVATLLFVRATRSQRGWLLSAAAAAMASHAKNLAGIVPAVVFLLSIGTLPAFKRPNRRRLLSCLLIFAGLNLAWLLPMALLHGRAFWMQYIGTEVLRRPLKAGSHSVASAASLYLGTLLAGFSPWAVIGLGGLVEDARKAAAQRDAGSVVVLLWVGVLSVLLCFGLRRANQWYLIPLLPFLAVSAGRLLLGVDQRPAWAEGWRVAVALAALAATFLWQVQPLRFPFALWSIERPHLELSSLQRLAGLSATLVAAAVVMWSSRRRMPTQQHGAEDCVQTMTRHRFSIVYAVIAVLGMAALHGVVPPLASADYHNVYVRARDVLQKAQGGRVGSVVVNTPQGRFDMITHYYFGNMDGLNATFVRQGPRAAVERARRFQEPVWSVLTARRGHLPPSAKLPGRVLFRGHEPLPRGGVRFELALVEMGSTLRERQP